MKKRILQSTLALVLAAGLLAGCGASEQTVTKKEAQTAAQEERTVVKIALCQQQMLESLPVILREKFPEVRFEFTLANNTADYYAYLDEHDALPDIITVRRFSLADASELKDSLVDLSSTDLAASYYQNYLQNYTYDDGTINWLPTLAEVWVIVANKTLFDENNIALPTDYASFVSACEQFEALGIQGFSTDWSYDYSVLETLQGFNVDKLQSKDGLAWRMDYESNATASLDDTVWPEAFSHFYDVLETTGNLGQTEEESTAIAERNFDYIQENFENGKIAMIRSSGGDIVKYHEDTGGEYVLLPYFGEDENWVLTYPYYQAAMSSTSGVDPELLTEIFEFMFSQEAQDVLGLGNNMLSYSADVEAHMNDYLTQLDSYLDSNRIYIRLANDQFFKASQAAVQGMLTGAYDAGQAYEIFNETLAAGDEDPVMDLKYETGYSYEFDAEHGSQSSSALLNSMREEFGTDLAVSYPIAFSNDIFAGEASSGQLAYLRAGNYGINYQMTLTGARIKELVGAMVHYEDSEDENASASYAGMIPVEDDMLPVTSGFEIEVERQESGYTLTKVKIDGKEIQDEAEYSIIYSVPSSYAAYIASQGGIDLATEAVKTELSTPEVLNKYLVEDGRQLAAPTDYVTIK